LNKFFNPHIKKSHSFKIDTDHVHKASELDKGRHERNFKKSAKKGKPEKDYSGDDSVTERLMKNLIPDTESPRQNDFMKLYI